MSEAVEEGTEPTEADGEQAAAEEAAAEDVARRVHPDTGGHQYTGDDSAAQVNDQSADE